MQIKGSCLFLALVVCSVGVRPAEAQLTSIGPFEGDISDDFESYPNFFVVGGEDTLAAAGGQALFSSNPVNSNQLRIFNTDAGATWGLGAYGRAGTHGGEQALGFAAFGPFPTDIDVNLDFPTPLSAVGFWYVTASNQFLPEFDFDMTVSLFDKDGFQIGTDQILDSGSSTYVWAGWSSTTPISRIAFSDNTGPALDDIQGIAIPEPTALTLATLALLPLTRRRRRIS